MTSIVIFNCKKKLIISEGSVHYIYFTGGERACGSSQLDPRTFSLVWCNNRHVVPLNLKKMKKRALFSKNPTHFKTLFGVKSTN